MRSTAAPSERFSVNGITSRYHPRCPTDKEATVATLGVKLDGTPQLRHHHLVEKLCAQCGAAMTCQQEAGCWCAELPKIPMPANNGGCLCRSCLLAKIEALQRAAKSNEA